MGEGAVVTIHLYTGTPGSGKSLHMASEIYWHVRMKRPVIANFDVNVDLFKDASSFTYAPNDVLTPEYLMEYARSYFRGRPFKEGSIWLYIDECQIMFGARDWASSGRKAWNTFFQQHRKLGYEVILVSQFDTMIDKQIRAVIEYEVKHRKLNNFGIVGKAAGLLFLGRPVCVCVRFWYPLKERVSSEWMLGRKRLYRLYDTAQIFGA